MARDVRREIGALGERHAAAHLARAGYEIVARNYRTPYGELDLIAADARHVVFCEVKTRLAGGPRGPAGPLDAIGFAKRRQVRDMAKRWLQDHPVGSRPARDELRFDAIGVTLSRHGELVALEHLEGAF